jgi:hypothetical protein
MDDETRRKALAMDIPPPFFLFLEIIRYGILANSGIPIRHPIYFSQVERDGPSSVMEDEAKRVKEPPIQGFTWVNP